MANQNPEKQNLTLGFFKSWWPILIALVAIVSMWVTMSLQIKQLQVDLARVENDSLSRDERIIQVLDKHLSEVAAVKTQQDAQYLDIQVTLTAIQKDIAYLRVEYETQEKGQ